MVVTAAALTLSCFAANTTDESLIFSSGVGTDPNSASLAIPTSPQQGSRPTLTYHPSSAPLISPLLSKRHRAEARRFSHLSPQRDWEHSRCIQGKSQKKMEGSDSPCGNAALPPSSPRSPSGRKLLLHDTMAKAKARDAQRVNDSMVYLDGPQVYTCAQCRTHLTSHDDIISKSFHGRHGRAYLFDQCVNVNLGPAEERRLITGLHTVCDIYCKRCKTLVGWTYQKAYESNQKYKEGKFIVEKINLHLEESHFDVAPPAGERRDRWRQRSMSWGDCMDPSAMIYEY